jgi:hypothetical protein
MRRVLGGDLRAVLAAPPGPATADLEALATASMEAHLERRLRSLAVLDRE